MDNVYEILKQLEIDFTEYKHEAVFTVGESKELDDTIPGTHTKNLFITNKKKDKLWLVLIQGSVRANLKKLRKFLNNSKISFASSELLKKYLNLTPGSVSPFGLINDKNHGVIVVIYDDVFEKNDTINFHPNINTATLNLKVENFKKFLNWTKNEIVYFKE